MSSPRPPTLDSQRCVQCFRPVELCHCHVIPTIDNQTEIVILQHRRERFHAFNTARMVRQSLLRCQLLTNHLDALADQFESLELSDRVGLLYPGVDSQLLTELDPKDFPDQLVVLDGTWHHAKSLMHAIRKLERLPTYRLAPASPSRYRIRREPNDQAISTVEATVAALKVLEPCTSNLDELLHAFDQMIDNQINRRDEFNWRSVSKRATSGVSNVPRALVGDLSNVVVAYGELDQGGVSLQQDKQRKPVYWVAERLSTGEVFRCAIASSSIQDESFLDCLRLSPCDFEEAVSIDQFRLQWQAFLHRGDEVAVYHPSTANLMRKIDPALTPSMILKSVKLEQNQGRGTLDDVVRSLGIETLPHGDSRACERLACAVGFVRYLNHLCNEHHRDSQ